MSTNEVGNLVMRTVRLPHDVDEEIKIVAFREDRRQDDVLCELIRAGLESLRSKGDPRVIRASKRPR